MKIEKEQLIELRDYFRAQFTDHDFCIGEREVERVFQELLELEPFRHPDMEPPARVTVNGVCGEYEEYVDREERRSETAWHARSEMLPIGRFVAWLMQHYEVIRR